MSRSFYLQLGLLHLRLVFVAYGNLAWSFLLGVKFGLVLFVYDGKSVGLFTFPPIGKLSLVFLAYGSPHRK